MSEINFGEMFSEFGALGYDVEQIALVLDVSDEDAGRLLNECQRKYNSGKAKFDFSVDKKLMEMALSGDLKAQQELDKRKRRRDRD